MNTKAVLVLCSQLSLAIAAPLMMIPMQQQIQQMPMQQQVQQMPMQHQQLMQQMLHQQLMQQMLLQEIQQQQMIQYQQQQIQALQEMSHNMPFMNFPSFMPIMVVPVNMEETDIDAVNQNQLKNKNVKITQEKSEKLELNDDDDDSMIVDAEPLSMESQQRKVFFLMPKNIDMSKARFSIGQWIESIPWLPFEINVPDTIAWAWNGIGSIIGGIGQGNPFRPFAQQMTSATSQQAATKLLNKQMTMMPLMPMPVLFMPMHFGPTLRP